MLLRRHIKTTRPCEKLDYRRLGPFRIIRKINDVAFRLELPPQLRIHPESTILGRITQPPPPIELEDGLEYEVAAILDSKIVRNKLYYLVDWLGYSPSDRTWEPIENVTNARALLEDFHHRYPEKISSYHQDDWADILHFAEFSYNNAIHASTKVTPFYAYRGYHPRWCVLETPEVSTNPCAEDRLERLSKIQAEP